MVIRSVTVEAFGTLSGPLTVPLHERLNVICGPNEAGKSTLMLAIWFAFTRKANSRAEEIKAIEPRTGGTPYVRVQFQRGGTAYDLEKRFAASDSLTKLEVKSPEGKLKEYMDDEADELLREALGFGKASGRTKTPAHYGMWPATWMDQHERSVDPGVRLDQEGDREGLSELLARLTGQVLAGADGEGLVERAREEYERYYTSSGKESKKSGAPLYESRDALAVAEDELSQLLDRQEEYEEDLRRHEDVVREKRSLQDQLPDLQDDLRTTESRKEKADALSAEVQTREARLETKVGVVERLRAEDERREILRKVTAMTEEEISTLDEDLNGAKMNLEIHKERREKLVRERDDAKQLNNRLKDELDLLQAQQDMLRSSEEHEVLKGNLETAKERQSKIAVVGASLAAIDITDEKVAELESLEQAHTRADAALESASVRVVVRAVNDVTVLWQRDQLDLPAGDEEERLVDARQTISIDETVNIEIEPGGENLSELRKKKEDAHDAFREALRQAGVASVREARRGVLSKSELSSEVNHLKQLLNEVAPDGVQALEEAVHRAKQSLEASRSQRDELTQSVKIPLHENAGEIRAQLEDVQQRADEAAAAFESAKEIIHQHDRETEKLTKNVELAQQALENARSKLDEREQELADRIDKEGADDDLSERLATARQEANGLEKDIENLKKELLELRADTIDVEIERAERALTQAKAELQRKRDELIILETRLGSVELHGLHEKLERARNEVDIAGQEVTRWEQKAEAAKLLYETLDAGRKKVEREFLAPLRDEAEDLLKQFFNSTDLTVELGSDFSVTELTRKSAGGYTPNRLSFGAREQLALILRLAMARLLAKEEPHPVFLDEALTDTDDTRFDVMANIIQQVARHTQIVVTTCHKNRFRKLGAHSLLDLEELQVQVA